jgi:hypothetical protein
MVRYFAGRLRDKQEIASITARLDQGLSPLRRENRDQKGKMTAPNPASLASWLAQLLKELVAARVAWGPSSFQQLTAQIVRTKKPTAKRAITAQGSLNPMEIASLNVNSIFL